MSNSRDDLLRHRSWLQKQLDAQGKSMPVFENVSPTYTIRVSREFTSSDIFLADIVAHELASHLGQGADVTRGTGVWDGAREDSATISLQADDATLVAALRILASIQGLSDAHVERAEPATSYVNLAGLEI